MSTAYDRWKTTDGAHEEWARDQAQAEAEHAERMDRARSIAQDALDRNLWREADALLDSTWWRERCIDRDYVDEDTLAEGLAEALDCPDRDPHAQIRNVVRASYCIPDGLTSAEWYARLAGVYGQRLRAIASMVGVPFAEPQR